MPIYVYEVVRPDDEPGDRFEVMQRISDDPLTEHPETGEPVRRVLTAAFVAGRWSPMAMKSTLNNDKKLGEMGFTKYVKSGKGTYEKRAGKGPRTIGGE